MDNLELWNKLKDPPEWAKKTIAAGRLRGYTDINPVWRLEVLTEQYGQCGVGWKYTIDKLWNEDANHGCVISFAIVTLYINDGVKWSDGIPGIGGSQMVMIETAGLHANDECYKMAVTDAISVACKALGIGAEVYKGDKTKHDKQSMQPTGNPNTKQPGKEEKKVVWLEEEMPAYAKARAAILDGTKTIKDIRKVYGVSKKLAEKLEAPGPDNIEGPSLMEDDGTLPF